MIAVDTNVLVHAHRRDGELHERCARAVRTLAEGVAAWALPWPVLHEFLAVVTHPRIFDPPSRLDEAVDQVDAWLESPSAVVVGETPEHWTALVAVLQDGQVAGPRIHDARMTALCVSQGVRTLWSFDRDFSRWTDRLDVRPPPE
ncbi:TA system VapC family ribonuclease toxin [Euzebya sp.]|uniref:TA system VapC family ribonuclease toxin n=1 Tax=Euzebya sp. TaxID=1971409 RepID=UPI003517740E